MDRICECAEVSYATLDTWTVRDAKQPYELASPLPIPELGPKASDLARMIIEDYAVWQGV